MIIIMIIKIIIIIIIIIIARRRYAADCKDPREELISLIVDAEKGRKSEKALRKELSLLDMNPVQVRLSVSVSLSLCLSLPL